MSRKTRPFAFAVAAASALITIGAGAQGRVDVSPAGPAVTLPASAVNVDAAAFDGAARTDDGRLQVMVELVDAPAASAYAAALGNASRLDPAALARAGAASRAQTLRVENAQATVVRALTATGAREMFRVSKSINAIAMAVDASDIAALQRTPGVRRVIPLVAEYPTNSTSVSFIGTPNVWANTIGLPAGADGTGIRIGVIDTGVDYMHASFGGTGLLADYQTESAATANFSTAGAFPTAKVVGGADFAGDAYTGSNAPTADPNPMDCNGHGSHVAGSAAGFGVNTDGTTFTGPFDANPATYSSLRIGPGTAPQALIYGLRVFGCSGSTGLTTLAVDWALDPNDDGDLSDHLDVINLSLGSNFGSAVSASSVAVENAAAAGMIVVASAGNASDTFFISGSPGASQRTIATAASVDGGVPIASVTANAPAAVAGNYFAGSAAFGPAPSGQTANAIVALDAADGAGPLTTDGCTTPFTNAAAIAGNIAIIDRGTCGFAVKALNAQLNGAIGVIVANNAPTAGATPPGMAGVDPSITIPTVLLALNDANTFKANIAGLNVTLQSAPGGDTLAGFSSRGPRSIIGSPLRLKPDIAAPGLNITSVQTGHTCLVQAGCTGVADPSGFRAGSEPLTISGTSMASPHMAGIMALLRQLKPEWSVEELKALAMNYATHDVTFTPNGGLPRFNLSRIGAGRVDPSQSAVANVVAMNAEDVGAVSIAFEPEVVGIVTQLKRVRVVNKGAAAQTYTLAFDNLLPAPGVTFSLPGGNSVTVPGGTAAEFDVQMSADASLMDQTRDPALSALQGIQANYGDQPRNFLTEAGAYLTFSQGASLALRLPVYMAAKPASEMHAADSIATGGAPTGSTTIPLTGTNLCTGTLGAGPTCTGTFPTDRESFVSPFELQVVSPLDPDLAAASLGHTDIRYAGVSYLPGSPSNINNDLIMFGVASWGDWSSLNEVAYNICVDTNEDGVYDRSVINASPSVFVANAALNDNAVRVVQNLSTGGFTILGLGSFVNLVSPTVVDTALHLNNVILMGVSPATLGMTAGDTTFRYKVSTCPATNPGCTRSVGGDQCSAPSTSFFDQAPGPHFWNWAAQGINFGGNFLDEDLNGNSLPVTWNTANMVTNGSVGALLLHHQNASGTRAEVVPLDTNATVADLAIASAITPASPTLGQNITLTLTASNMGPGAASGVSVTDVLPAGLTHVSDNGGGAYDPVTGVWTIGALANAGTQTLDIVATVDTTDPVTNSAWISTVATIDPNPANDHSEVTVSAPRSSDLAIAASVSTPTVLVGGSVTYTLTVTNTGVDPAYSVNVAESFAAFPLLAPDSFTASQGVYDPGTGTWNLASLDTGRSATLVLDFIAPNTAGPLTNDSTVAGGSSDPDTVDNTASATTTVLSPSSVTSTKTASGDTHPGGTVTYTVTLSNSAAFDQQDNPGSEFVDVLPAALTLVSATATSGTAAATIGTNTVDWNGAVAAGGSVSITIIGSINAGTVGAVVSNQGTVNSDADGNGVNEQASLTDDPGVAGASDPTVFTVVASSDLGLTLIESPDPVAAGATYDYTATVLNDGPNDADNVVVAFTLPGGVIFVSGAVQGGGSCVDGAPVLCTFTGALLQGPGNTRDATITVAVALATADGTVLNTSAQASSDSNDPGPLVNGAEAATTVANAADLSIALVDSPDPVTAGSDVTYVATASNAGPSNAEDVAIAFTLPAGTTLVSATPTAGGVCVAATCTFAGITAPSATHGVTYVVSVPGDAAGGSLLEGTATVSSTVGDPQPANDSATTGTTVDAIADLSVTITDAPDPVAAGSDVTYAVTGTNNGAGIAQGMVIDIALAANTTLVSATPTAGGTCVGTVCTFAGTTAVAGTHGVTYVATLDAAAVVGSTFDASASISGSTTDPEPVNNNATTTSTVADAADVSITLVDSPDPVTAGSDITYVATASNAGPSDAEDVAIVFTLPAGTTLVSATPTAGGACAAATCTFAGATAASATRGVTYVVSVPDDVFGGSLLEATATVSNMVDDPQPANNSAAAETTVDGVADLSIAIGDAPDPVAAGGDVTYTVSGTNHGAGWAQDMVIDLALAANTTLLSATPSMGGACIGTTCTFAGNTSVGGVHSVTYVATLDAAAVPGSTFDATASISGATTDPDPANNGATATTTVADADPADLALTLTSSSTSISVDETVTFTATSINLGPGVADDVVVTVPLGGVLRFASFTVSAGGTCTAPAVGETGTVVCTWPGETAADGVHTVTVTATAAGAGTASVSATTSSPSADPVVANDSAAVQLVVLGGTVAPVDPAVIPAFGREGMLALMLLLGLFGLVSVRRRI